MQRRKTRIIEMRKRPILHVKTRVELNPRIPTAHDKRNDLSGQATYSVRQQIKLLRKPWKPWKPWKPLKALKPDTDYDLLILVCRCEYALRTSRPT